MWSPLLKPLEWIGRIRLPFMRTRTGTVVGGPREPDALGTYEWQAFLDARALSRVWGPHEHSPWMPFHCVTLFVSLEYMNYGIQKVIGPCAQDPWPLKNFQLPAWVDASVLLVVDLPGPKSAAVGAALAIAGCDLVCTFNNWPYFGALVKPEQTLAALLRYASLLDKKRTAYTTPGPAAWLCDNTRLGSRPGKPGEFDNRYYIEDSIIPGPNYLRERDISKIIYITGPDINVQNDIKGHLHFLKTAGLELYYAVALDTGSLGGPKPLNIEELKFSTTGFFRSSAGGFGAPVPHPSSGG